MINVIVNDVNVPQLSTLIEKQQICERVQYNAIIAFNAAKLLWIPILVHFRLIYLLCFALAFWLPFWFLIYPIFENKKREKFIRKSWKF